MQPTLKKILKTTSYLIAAVGAVFVAFFSGHSGGGHTFQKHPVMTGGTPIAYADAPYVGDSGGGAGGEGGGGAGGEGGGGGGGEGGGCGGDGGGGEGDGDGG